MEHDQSPLRGGQRLTLELFDYYVARAQAERAEAIAQFGGQVAAWLSNVAGRLARQGRRAGRRGIAGTEAARWAPGDRPDWPVS
ncbi:MAG TPA: hypothetical protein VGQ35_05115 [Dongiaceae bacterium]|jgi:hypothetical protein|nr:hypothetical protein [Dongiaceae bacterium]